MSVCFASKLEAMSPDSDEYFELLRNGDEFCLLDEGHDGEHVWTPQADITVRLT